MEKGVVAGVVVLVAIIAITAAYLGLYHGTSKALTTTSSVSTTVKTTLSTSTSTDYTTISSNSESLQNCSDFQLLENMPDSQASGECSWSGGSLGVWVKAGDAGFGTIQITGADNYSYLNQSFAYNCTTFLQNLTLPAQDYYMVVQTGVGGGSCGDSLGKLNLSTSAPPVIYPYVYNGNFSDGEYTGWEITGAGFGTTPFNITSADNSSENCYLGSKWAGYDGDYFATTYNCGLNNEPGNLTSPFFRVNPNDPFLNFRIISPEDLGLYVEVLEANYKTVQSGNQTVSEYINSTPEIVAHFDTYNISLTPNASSTFQNATIPLGTLINKVVRVRIVADTLVTQRYIAAGDFQMQSLPNSKVGIASNITILNH